MREVRDFDAEIAERQTEQTGDPIQFKLNGYVFTCVNPLPAGSLLVMVRKAAAATKITAGAVMGDLMAAAGIVDVFWTWIIPEDHDEFDKAISHLSDMGVFEELIEHIMTEATGRPTPGSSS